MNVPRVFVSYYQGKEPNQEQQLVQQLINDLRAAGTEVVIDGGRNTDEEFFQFIARELPTCRWVIFVQTAETLQSSRARIIFSTALKLIEQQSMQGLLRVVPSTTETIPAPPEWAELNMTNIAIDYPKALEKLLFSLSIGDTDSLQKVETSETPLLPRRVSHFSSPPPTYDRPLAPPPRMVMLRDMPYTIGRKNIMIGSIVLASLLLLLVITVVLVNVLRPATPINTVVGNAYFTSSELFDIDGTKGANDGINVILNNLSAPASGNSYYVWLLPDTQTSEANTIFIGNLSPIHNNVATLNYISPKHDNLLNLASRLLVTEESSAITPSTPATDRGMWRFEAAIPQTSSGSSGMGTQLSNLKALLFKDPALQSQDKAKNLNLQGGVAFWFHQNLQKVMLEAKDARENPQTANVQGDALKILNYIDGSGYVTTDAPNNQPLNIDGSATRIALLTIDQEHENPSGFDQLIGTHLSGMVGAPEATGDVKSQISLINTALNQLVGTLKQMRIDATSLLTTPNDIKTLNNLYNESLDSYYGHFDPASGNRIGGAIWIYDHIQHLAHFTVKLHGS